MKYTLYDTTTGRILRSGTCQDNVASLLVRNPDEAVLTGQSWDDSEWRIVNGAPAPLLDLTFPALSVPAGQDWTMDIPEGSLVWVDENCVLEADSEGATLSFSASGSYEIWIESAFPYRNTSATLEVT